uniref:DUF4899 domain-containing protein n=1 Tax=Rhabditophanes sp. KR3021 TaxID=114890 RepID=A0AC35UF76_9BILA
MSHTPTTPDEWTIVADCSGPSAKEPYSTNDLIETTTDTTVKCNIFFTEQEALYKSFIDKFPMYAQIFGKTEEDVSVVEKEGFCIISIGDRFPEVVEYIEEIPTSLDEVVKDTPTLGEIITGAATSDSIVAETPALDQVKRHCVNDVYSPTLHLIEENNVLTMGEEVNLIVMNGKNTWKTEIEAELRNGTEEECHIEWRTECQGQTEAGRQNKWETDSERGRQTESTTKVTVNVEESQSKENIQGCEVAKITENVNFDEEDLFMEPDFIKFYTKLSIIGTTIALLFGFPLLTIILALAFFIFIFQ